MRFLKPVELCIYRNNKLDCVCEFTSESEREKYKQENPLPDGYSYVKDYGLRAESKGNVMTHKQYELTFEIAKRAENLVASLHGKDRLSLLMDIECAFDTFNLRLEDLLAADDFNFKHDILGIQSNLNRATKKFENCFVPRFAGEKDNTEGGDVL